MDATILAMLVLIFAAPVPADGPEGCAGFSIEVPVERTLASAATVPNLLGLPHSLQSESHRMLIESERIVSLAEPPPDSCPGRCTLSDTPEIVFRSAPAVVLDAYGDAEKCERLLETTSQRPFMFADREFRSVDDLSDWVGLFTRGKGEDGEALYRLCGGQCSPAYVWVISQDAGRLVVDAEVTCGHARDRDDNRYDLSYSIRWTCR